MNDIARPYPASRILSVDMFRGLTILAMIFVNKYHEVADRPQWGRHMSADANVLTFMDAVFPAFLFIVGMAMPFAVQARINKGCSLTDVAKHSVLRGLSLVLVGVFMVNTYWGYDADTMPFSINLWALLMYGCFLLAWCQYPRHWSKALQLAMQWTGFCGLVVLAALYQGLDDGWMKVQWWGILGLIGWAYIVAVPAYLISQRIRFLVAFVLGYFAIFLLLFPVQAEPGSTLAWLLENKNHFTHAATILLGVIFAQCIYHRDFSEKAHLYGGLYCVLVLVAAFAFWQISPISKIWGTPTWVLFSVFFCSLFFLLLHWLIDTQKWTAWTRPFDAVASNSLFMYLLPFMIVMAERLSGFTLRGEAYELGLAGALWSVGFTLAVMLLGTLLTKAGLRLKL